MIMEFKLNLVAGKWELTYWGSVVIFNDRQTALDFLLVLLKDAEGMI